MVGALAIGSKLVGGFANKVSTGTGLVGKLFAGKVKEDGFLAKTMPNIFGAGSAASKSAAGAAAGAGKGPTVAPDAGAGDGGDTSVKWYKQKWFLPTAIGVGILAIGGTIWAIVRGKRKNKKRW